MDPTIWVRVSFTFATAAISLLGVLLVYANWMGNLMDPHLSVKVSFLSIWFCIPPSENIVGDPVEKYPHIFTCAQFDLCKQWSSMTEALWEDMQILISSRYKHNMTIHGLNLPNNHRCYDKMSGIIGQVLFQAFCTWSNLQIGWIVMEIIWLRNNDGYADAKRWCLDSSSKQVQW